MADIFEKAKKFPNDRTKAKGNCDFVKDFFSLKTVTKAHLFNLCNVEKMAK